MQVAKPMNPRHHSLLGGGYQCDFRYQTWKTQLPQTKKNKFVNINLKKKINRNNDHTGGYM